MTMSEGIMDNLIKSSAIKYFCNMIELLILVFLNHSVILHHVDNKQFMNLNYYFSFHIKCAKRGKTC